MILLLKRIKYYVFYSLIWLWIVCWLNIIYFVFFSIKWYLENICLFKNIYLFFFLINYFFYEIVDLVCLLNDKIFVGDFFNNLDILFCKVF